MLSLASMALMVLVACIGIAYLAAVALCMAPVVGMGTGALTLGSASALVVLLAESLRAASSASAAGSALLSATVSALVPLSVVTVLVLCRRLWHW